MNEFILFGAILLIGIVVFLLMKNKKRKREALRTQNYDDKFDRIAEQLDNS